MARPKTHLPSPGVMNKLPQPIEAVVILFSAPDCTYCEQVRSRTLRHVETDPRYVGWVKVYEVEMEDTRQGIVWFDGQVYHGKKLKEKFNVSFSPTVIAFDNQGRAVGKPLLGAGLEDFYGAYLHDLIMQAASSSRR